MRPGKDWADGMVGGGHCKLDEGSKGTGIGNRVSRSPSAGSESDSARRSVRACTQGSEACNGAAGAGTEHGLRCATSARAIR
jgi:hypothetical protein